MQSLRKNAILSGHLDFLCLVCQEYMRSESDVYVHINKPVHQKKLDSAYVVGKCKEDIIIKVQNGYYCAFCNQLISMASKLHLHVSEKSHMSNKGNQLLKRVGNFVVAFDSLLIEERAWCGLLGDSCVVCNVDYVDENLHRSDQRHAVNLIQNKVQFGNNLQIYRKVDDTTFYCVTCNDLFSMYSFSNHFENDDHKKSIKMCLNAYAIFHKKLYQDTTNTHRKVSKCPKENCKKIVEIGPNQCLNDNTSGQSLQSDSLSDEYYSTETNDLSVENKHNIMDSIHDFERQSVRIDLEDETAFCIKCSIYIDFDCEFISNHIKLHNKFGAETVDVFNNLSEQCEIDMFGKSRETSEEVKSKNEPEYTINGLLKVDKNQNNIDVKSRNIMIETETCDVISGITDEKVVVAKQHVSASLDKENDPVVTDKDNALTDNKLPLFESINYFEKNCLNIDFISGIAFCRKCYESLELNYDVLMSHIEVHNTSPKKRNLSYVPFQCEVDMTAKPSNTEIKRNEKVKPCLDNAPHESETKNDKIADEASSCEDPAEFARQNKITFNVGHDNAYCRVCQKKMPSTLRSMKEHVAGLPHRKNVAASLCPPKYPSKSVAKCTFRRFINEEISIGNFLYTEKVLNGKFCISQNSYNCITETNCRLRCQLCEENIIRGEISAHVDNYIHEIAMGNTFVLTSWDSEFVREVRPGLYHCGFCNLISLDMENLQQHFKSIQHKQSKTKAETKLIIHGPRIAELRRRHAHEIAFQRYMSMRF